MHVGVDCTMGEMGPRSILILNYKDTCTCLINKENTIDFIFFIAIH